ncbi:MAG: sodium:proton antiporter [Clostridia bacterium]|nr:sodium:proton antiporter [Clostridia bacterium]
MLEAYKTMYGIVLPILGLILIACLIKAILGPRVADRVIAVNMMGTTVVIIICILAFVMNEGYLTDVAIIYTMLSFLAVVLLTKVFMGIYREKRRKAEEAEKNA